MSKKIALTGGGTAGHVTPNLSLLPGLKERGFEIEYIGSETGIERNLVEKEGIKYFAISTGKLRRYLDHRNITDAFKVVKGFFQAIKILANKKPDILFSKGGFVSCPVVWAAWLLRIPVIIHESDITPGLTNKLSAPFSRIICFSFPESAAYVSKKKGILTGLPVRKSITSGNKAQGLKLCGFSSNKPVLMIIGGSQGSEKINGLIRSTLNFLIDKYDICHICGEGRISQTHLNRIGYKQFEYVNEELADLFAAADFVVSRAGATTLFELLALCKPALVIPLSKKASRGDQILNARSFKKSGYCSVIQEEDISFDSFLEKIDELVQNKNRYIEKMQTAESFNGTENTLKQIDSLIFTISNNM